MEADGRASPYPFQGQTPAILCFATYREVRDTLRPIVTVCQDEETQVSQLWIEADFLVPTNFCFPCGDGSHARNGCSVLKNPRTVPSVGCAASPDMPRFCAPGTLPLSRCLVVLECRCSLRPSKLRSLTCLGSSTMSSPATSTQAPRLGMFPLDLPRSSKTPPSPASLFSDIMDVSQETEAVIEDVSFSELVTSPRRCQCMDHGLG